MELLMSWKNSLELLKPNNLKQFLLVSLKTVIDFYRGLNSFLADRANWTLIIICAVLIALAHIVTIWHLFIFESLLLNGLRWIFIFLLCLTFRDSVSIKDRDYFMTYIKRYWYVLSGALLLGFTGIEAIPFISLWYTLFLLFAFDTRGGIAHVVKRLYSSAVMLVYNLPVSVALYVTLSILGIVLYRLEAWALGYVVGLIFIMCFYFLLLPIQIALISNFYIKRIHDQPDVYFKQPQQ